MGTSRGISTPSGGPWTDAKRRITSVLDGAEAVAAGGGQPTQEEIVQSVLQAMGGLGLGIPAISRGGRSGNVGAGGGGGSSRQSSGVGRAGGGRDGASRAKSRAVGKSIAGLGGFGSAVRDRGLTEALRDINLGELEGRPAAEVIATVSERLAEGSSGVDAELLRTALNETILEAAQLNEEVAYTDLEAGLQSFLNENGVEGLVELFLTRFVTDLVTAAVFEHIDTKAENAAQAEALLSGIETACRNKAQATIAAYRTSGQFSRTNWFGGAGSRLGREIAGAMLTELGAQ